MPIKQQHQPILLPARMSLAPDALTDTDVAVLFFPFVKEVTNFCDAMKRVLRSKHDISPPYRQLNNAILACTPTLTHGFERVASNQAQQAPCYRTLAAGTPATPLRPPSAAQLHGLIKGWAQEWTRPFRGKGHGQADSVCDRFLALIAIMPEDWDWISIDPEIFIDDISAEKGLAFEVIPGLLATLLHNKRCIIHDGQGNQEIVWRKVQGTTSNRTGLFLVSKPFNAWYVDQYGNEKQGYFAYRLDFHVETQTGRCNELGKLQPWIFPHLSCQRYTHERLAKPNYGRDISVLMGMNEARLSGCNVDSALVRLVIEHGGNRDKSIWKYQLPEYLAAFKARALEEPDKILGNPVRWGNLQNDPGWQKDEYYLVHAEGYEYGDEGGTSRHAVKTGYSLQEHGDIIARVLELLSGTLKPDVPMDCDIPAPSGRTTPLAMRDFAHISAPPTITAKQRKSLDAEAIRQLRRKRQQERQRTVANALKHALSGELMHLYIIWRERDTREAVYRQVRKTLLLDDNDDFPAHITVSEIWIDDATLLEPLDTNGITPKTWPAFKQQLRKQHIQKRDTWRVFLKRVLPRVTGWRFAIVEMRPSRRKGIHPLQSIKGPIREAFALEKIGTQMLQTIKEATTKHDRNGGETLTYSAIRTKDVSKMLC